MRNYFIKLYSETGKKPFTFLNALLLVLLPVVVFVYFACITSSDSWVNLLGPTIGTLVVSWAIDIVLTYLKFKDVGTTVKVTLLSILASIAFFCKLILFPLIKFLFRASSGMTDMQMGNTEQASSTMNHSQGVKTSAFNWFNYNGVDIQDIPGDDEPTDGYTYNNNAWDSSLQRSYTDDEDNNARQKGYQNASHAVNSGVNISDLQ